MLWQGRRESENVEDERGSSGGRRLVVSGGIGTVVLVIIYLLLGGDPQALFNSQQGAQLSQPAQFRRGYETGDVRQGDTFNAPYL